MFMYMYTYMYIPTTIFINIYVYSYIYIPIAQAVWLRPIADSKTTNKFIVAHDLMMMFT
jgi:hypothetical protein